MRSTCKHKVNPRMHVCCCLQDKAQKLPEALQGTWSSVPAWTATLLFMFQPVAQLVSSHHLRTVCLVLLKLVLLVSSQHFTQACTRLELLLLLLLLMLLSSSSKSVYWDYHQVYVSCPACHCSSRNWFPPSKFQGLLCLHTHHATLPLYPMINRTAEVA